MISLGIVSRAQNYEMERTDSPMGNSTAIALACSGAGNSVQPGSGARKHLSPISLAACSRVDILCSKE